MLRFLCGAPAAAPRASVAPGRLLARVVAAPSSTVLRVCPAHSLSHRVGCPLRPFNATAQQQQRATIAVAAPQTQIQPAAAVAEEAADLPAEPLTWEGSSSNVQADVTVEHRSDAADSTDAVVPSAATTPAPAANESLSATADAAADSASVAASPTSLAAPDVAAADSATAAASSADAIAAAVAVVDLSSPAASAAPAPKLKAAKTREPKAPKEPKPPKEPKEPKAPKAPKEPKPPKAPKEPKPPKEPKAPKAPKIIVPAEVKARVKELTKLIVAANKLYYGPKGASKLSDAEFDAMFQELQGLEAAHPSLLKPTSPTQIVGSDMPPPANRKTKKGAASASTAAAAASIGSAAVPHTIPMLSLDSTTDLEKVRAWDAGIVKKLAALNKTKKGAVVPAANSAAVDASASPESLAYTLELKYDGIAVSLLYRDRKLVRVLTRGTGEAGEDVTHSFQRWVTSVPSTLADSAFVADPTLAQYAAGRCVEVRGEVILTKSRHAQYTAFQQALNKEHAAAGRKEVKDAADTPARNVTAGLLRRDMSEEDSLSENAPAVLNFVAYGLHIHHPSLTHASPYLVQPEGGPSKEPAAIYPQTQSQAMELLESLGMPVRIAASEIEDQDVAKEMASIPVFQRLSGIDAVCSALESLCAHRSSLDFAIDGFVLKLDSFASAYRLGTTSHHPKSALAFKFPAKGATTTLQSITWQVGRSSRITPVAELAPTTIDGANVRRASLHNVSTLTDLSLAIGDTVLVERKGDVIPQIVSRVDSDAPRGALIEVPKICPCPRASTLVLKPAVSDPSRVELCCVDADCPPQRVQAIEFYASRGCLDIRGLGGATISLLDSAGFVKSLADVVRLPSRRAELLAAVESGKIAGMGVKSAEKLCDSIDEAHAQASDETLLVSLGIPRLGFTQARALLDNVGSLEALLSARAEDLHDIPGCGPKLIEAFSEAFAVMRDSEIIAAWRELGILARAVRVPKPKATKASKEPKAKRAPKEPKQPKDTQDATAE